MMTPIDYARNRLYELEGFINALDVDGEFTMRQKRAHDCINEIRRQLNTIAEEFYERG